MTRGPTWLFELTLKKLNSWKCLHLHSILKRNLFLSHDQVSISPLSLSLSSLIFSSGSFNFSIHEINFEFWIILNCLYFFVINIYTLSHLFSKLQIMYFVFHIPLGFFLLYTLNPVATHGFHLFWSPPPMEVNLDWPTQKPMSLSCQTKTANVRRSRMRITSA